MAKNSTYHSARTGRFVSPGYAATHPSTTVRVTSGSKPTDAPRDAGTGRFVPQGYADGHPSTTVQSK